MTAEKQTSAPLCDECGEPIPYGQHVTRVDPPASFDADCFDRLYVGGPIAYVRRPPAKGSS